MAPTEITEAEAQYATYEEAQQLLGKLKRMTELLHRDELEMFLALRAETEAFYSILRQRAVAAGKKAMQRRSLTSCQPPSEGHPISCSAPPVPSCPRT